MAGVAPSVGQVGILNKMLEKAGDLDFPWTIFLWSNDITPDNDTVTGDLTVVSGGGYAPISVADGAGWTVSGGNPAQAVMDAFQDFEFTGATASPGVVRGFGLKDANDILIEAQRFDSPLTPVNGSLIRIKPRLRTRNPTA